MKNIPYIFTLNERRRYRLDLVAGPNCGEEISDWIQDRIANGHEPDQIINALPSAYPDCVSSIDDNEEDTAFREVDIDWDEGDDPNFKRLEKAWTKFLDRNVHSSNKNGLCLGVDIPKASFWVWFFDYSVDGSQYVLRIQDHDKNGQKLEPEAYSRMQFIATTFINTWTITEEEA